MNGQIDPIEYGKLDERVQHIDKRVTSMAEKVDSMHDVLMRTQGGWKVIIAVGGFFAAVGAVFSKFIEWWFTHMSK